MIVLPTSGICSAMVHAVLTADQLTLTAASVRAKQSVPSAKTTPELQIAHVLQTSGTNLAMAQLATPAAKSVSTARNARTILPAQAVETRRILLIAGVGLTSGISLATGHSVSPVRSCHQIARRVTQTPSVLSAAIAPWNFQTAPAV